MLAHRHSKRVGRHRLERMRQARKARACRRKTKRVCAVTGAKDEQMTRVASLRSMCRCFSSMGARHPCARRQLDTDQNVPVSRVTHGHAAFQHANRREAAGALIVANHGKLARGLACPFHIHRQGRQRAKCDRRVAAVDCLNTARGCAACPEWPPADLSMRPTASRQRPHRSPHNPLRCRFAGTVRRC